METCTRKWNILQELSQSCKDIAFVFIPTTCYSAFVTTWSVRNDIITVNGCLQSWRMTCILQVTFFSNEACFHVTGYVNSHSSRIRSTENPRSAHETSGDNVIIGVWCAVPRHRIVGQTFIFRNYHELGALH